jgi:hypothetical protein
MRYYYYYSILCSAAPIRSTWIYFISLHHSAQSPPCVHCGSKPLFSTFPSTRSASYLQGLRALQDSFELSTCSNSECFYELGIQNYHGELVDLVDGKNALNHSA